MTRKQRRGVLIGVSLSVLMVAVGLVLYALRDSIVFFHTPSDVAEKSIAAGQRFRLGGLVADGSGTRGAGATVECVGTDTPTSVSRTSDGVLPALLKPWHDVGTEGSPSAPA